MILICVVLIYIVYFLFWVYMVDGSLVKFNERFDRNYRVNHV